MFLLPSICKTYNNVSVLDITNQLRNVCALFVIRNNMFYTV